MINSLYSVVWFLFLNFFTGIFSFYIVSFFKWFFLFPSSLLFEQRPTILCNNQLNWYVSSINCFCPACIPLLTYMHILSLIVYAFSLTHSFEFTIPTMKNIKAGKIPCTFLWIMNVAIIWRWSEYERKKKNYSVVPRDAPLVGILHNGGIQKNEKKKNLAIIKFDYH